MRPGAGKDSVNGREVENYFPNDALRARILELDKTLKRLREALKFVTDAVSSGGTVLFVGTKRQAQDVIEEDAKRAGMPFVTHRWLGGTLTNFITIRKNLARYREIIQVRE